MSAVFPAWVEAIAKQASTAVDRDAILEALASVHAVGIVSDLLGIDALSDSRFGKLRARGRLLLGAPRSARVRASTDADRAAHQAEALARAGLLRLEGAASPTESHAQGKKRVPEASLLRLIRGELDGFRAAELARELCSDPASVVELRLLLGLPQRAAPLRLAAEGPTTLRDPSDGTVVGRASVKRGRLGAVALEAVRFADGVVAVYASQPLALDLAPVRSKTGAQAKPRGRTKAGGKTIGGQTEARIVGAAPGYLELSGAEGRVHLHLDGSAVELALDTARG